MLCIRTAVRSSSDTQLASCIHSASAAAAAALRHSVTSVTLSTAAAGALAAAAPCQPRSAFPARACSTHLLQLAVLQSSSAFCWLAPCGLYGLQLCAVACCCRMRHAPPSSGLQGCSTCCGLHLVAFTALLLACTLWPLQPAACAVAGSYPPAACNAF